MFNVAAHAQVGGTEAEVLAVATDIAGSATADTMYSWIRAKIYLLNTAVEPLVYEWALIKCQSTDALQDLSDEAVMEKLQKESRIFAREFHATGKNESGLKPISFELYNVKLDLGEELRLVVLPHRSTAGATAEYYGVLEWRQVGV